MKFLSPIVISLVLLLFTTKLKAQDSLGTLRLFIYPDSVRVLLDDSLKLPAKTTLQLKKGVHTISVRGKDLKPVNKSIVIQADSLHTMHIIMKKSDEYIAYKKEMRSYLIKKNSIKYGGAFIPVGFAGLSILSYVKSKSTVADYKATYEQYLVASNLSDIENLKNDADELQEQYNKQYNAVYIYAGAAVVTSYLYYRFAGKMIKKLDKPVYRENLSSNFFFDPQQNVHFSISYKF